MRLTRNLALLLASSLALPLMAAPIPRFVFVDGSERLARKIDCSARAGEPGFSLAVLHRDELLLRLDCGLADLEHREPIGPDTRFDVGEISRTFTAAAMLQLVEKGLVDLDEPVSRLLPELPAWAQQVRVMHLLNRTSGVPDPPADPRSAEPRDRERVMRFLRRETRPSFDPGTDFDLGPSGYVLLAELVERASGRRFAEYLEREIFRPLALDHTTVLDESELPVPDRAKGYRSRGDGWVAAAPGPVAANGATGIYTTVDDLRLWQRALDLNLLLEPRTTAMMFHMPLTLTGKQSGLAMGWLDATVTAGDPRHDGLRAISAIGRSPGFAASLSHFPDEELTIILLANSAEPPGFLSGAFADYLIRVPTEPRPAPGPVDSFGPLGAN